nr:EAL domain-containing protein [Raoultella sp. 18111]
MEALVRWHDKIFGQVPPDLFISMAEQLNVSDDISALVIEKATRELKTILQADADFTLAINIGKSEISNPRFLDNLMRVLKRHDIRRSRLKLKLPKEAASTIKRSRPFHYKR